MKWVGDPKKDTILTLLKDESGSVILGQVSFDSEADGWNGFDYTAEGEIKRLGLFESVIEAKVAVAESVEGNKLNA